MTARETTEPGVATQHNGDADRRSLDVSRFGGGVASDSQHTALRASVVDIQRFPSARHFASWLGLTSREHSSGERRRLGRISKQGDVYLRTLLIHGARTVLIRAKACSKPDRFQSWALELQKRSGHNKAAIAVANKLARIVWAVWKSGKPFESRSQALT